MVEWNPWQEIQRLRHDIDRAFEQVEWRNGGRNGRTFPTAFLPGHAARAYPLVNVSEDTNALYVTALAPGLDPTAIQLTVQDNRLTMAGEKPRVAAEVQPEAFHRSERAAGKFVRTVTTGTCGLTGVCALASAASKDVPKIAAVLTKSLFIAAWQSPNTRPLVVSPLRSPQQFRYRRMAALARVVAGQLALVAAGVLLCAMVEQ